MKIPISKLYNAALAVGVLLLVLPQAASAITSVVQFAKNDPDFPMQVRLDPFYNQLDSNGNFVSGDGNSSVFLGQVVEGDLVADLSARYYDSDPLRPGTNGLINSDLPWNRADPDTPEPGWLVRFGLDADAVGVFTHTYDSGGGVMQTTPASYVSFKIRSADQVIYETASLILTDTVNVTPSTVWAVASDENFQITRLATTAFSNDDGHELRWDWSNLAIGSAGLEIRVYGILGADEGYFGVECGHHL
jgi:hypothetical protein